MKFIKTEHHQVNSIFEYNIPDDHIVDAFGSLQRFEEIVSHANGDNSFNTPFGEPPTDEEYDQFLEFIEVYDYDREDDWWTDRKGGYDISYQVGEVSDEELDDSDDFDDELGNIH